MLPSDPEETTKYTRYQIQIKWPQGKILYLHSMFLMCLVRGANPKRTQSVVPFFSVQGSTKSKIMT